MSQNTKNRQSIIYSLLPERSERLLDVGCGPINPSYPYADKATYVTCVDWKLHRTEPIPPNIECLESDFTKIDLPLNTYDTIIASDVFEHILLEQESLFIQKCLSVLKPGGHMIVTVPHQGAFAWLDPYRVKPAIHGIMWRLGVYNGVYNGFCDIRKGHKHYKVEDLAEKFKPLKLLQVSYWGYFFDPLLSWAVVLSRSFFQCPGYRWLEQSSLREFKHDYGLRAFNVALKFYKPTDVEKVGTTVDDSL